MESLNSAEIKDLFTNLKSVPSSKNVSKIQSLNLTKIKELVANLTSVPSSNNISKM